MKIGLLAYSTNTGLGYQTLYFYQHMKPAKTLVVDISKMNDMPTHHERYPDARITDGVPNQADCEWITDDIDVLFVCETPLNYDLFAIAYRKGVKVVLQFNYEFLDYLSRPTLPQPTVFAAPTVWNIKKLSPRRFPRVEMLQVPINTESLPKREITEAKTFIHIMGRPAVHDRNGTLYFIEAVKKVQDQMPDAFFTIYAQSLTTEVEEAIQGTEIMIIVDSSDPEQMYWYGDVLVMPRRYGGLCLPVNEALGCGIPVIMPNIDPNSSVLPQEWLFGIEPKVTQFRTRSYIEVYTPKVGEIAEMMLFLYKNPSKVAEMSRKAKELGRLRSWDLQKDYYNKFFESLCTSRY